MADNQQTTCEAPDCDRPRHGRQSLCSMHWKRMRRHGSLERQPGGAKPKPAPEQCIVDGCDGPVVNKEHGWCQMHYARWRRTGDVGDATRRKTPQGGKCAVAACDREAKNRGLCAGHYQRKLKTGAPGESPLRGDADPSPCSADGCDRPSKALTFCYGHYQRFKKHGDVLADVPLQEKISREGACDQDGCDAPVFARRLCNVHYQRSLDGRDMSAAIKRKAHKPGEGFINKDGYRVFKKDGVSQFEHRIVAEQVLGRPLLPTENVHHINGVRHDNTIDGPLRVVNGRLRSGNLELWSTSQPPGQDIASKVAWARELLAQYGDLTAN